MLKEYSITDNRYQLKNKKVLLFIPFFFNYEKIIAQKFIDLGAQVVLYNERAVVKPFSRAILKIVPGIFNCKTRKYYYSIIERHKSEKFDYILFVRCDMPTLDILITLRSTFPYAKMCLYLWDSIKNTPKITKKIKFFDFASSFDRKDCKSSLDLNFCPLFYFDGIVDSVDNRDSKKDFDMLFCGTIHSDRFNVLKKIMQQSYENNLRYYGFHYLQSKFIFWFYKFTKKEFFWAKKFDFAFVKKSNKDISELEKRSKAIIDIQHPKQTGLTMRTIEMIGMKKKLITTNKDIVNYDFYNENNILIIDRNNPIIDKSFFEKPYIELSKNIYEKYNLENWIYGVLGISVKGTCDAT